ncbi:MAG TPA: hypothetical protein VK729_03025 [Silvibacterium sp.]|nr:hypothetical protein [Silvibacterium sp.]
MHTTWFFFCVFTAVWLTSLLWMWIERRRRQLSFSQQEAYWMGWISLSVFSAAVLYGLGTNGLLVRRFPKAVPVSDMLAMGFMLALPAVAWSRLFRQQEGGATGGSDERTPSHRNFGILGLNDGEPVARSIEHFDRLEVVPVDLLPAAQIFHPEQTGEHPNTAPMKAIPIEAITIEANPIEATQDRLIETAELLVPSQLPIASPPMEASAPLPETVPVAPEAPATKGIDGFREHLSVLNGSWQRIETIREEIDEWFEQRRRLALAHLETHPGVRSSGLAMDLFQDFPNDKLAAVDAQWGEIRRAALEISRWFGDIPQTDRAN